MLFNSPIYIFLFLPIAATVYFYLNKVKLVTAGKSWLVLCSIYFYGYWHVDYVPLIVSSILVNFGIGSSLSNESKIAYRIGASSGVHKKAILIAGLVFNVSLLGYYKYADFFISNVNSITGENIPLLHVVLPIAISFFTFQQIAYLVDSYLGRVKENDFLNYCLFVTFFPQLIAGPIVHHSEMMPQFANLRGKLINWRNVFVGTCIFGVGLFKKVAIADTFSIWADAGYSAGHALDFFEAWTSSLSYTMQLYYDFSGYSDMAIGAALLFNVHLPDNFNSPYKAVSIREFWQRWHITLSRWLRDYIYIPMGGNKRGLSRTSANLFTTFIIGGIWHGAGWTFVIWGAMHGVALVVHRFWMKVGFKMWGPLAWVFTFLFVHISWVFFRSEDLNSAITMLSSMVEIDSARVSLAFSDQASSIFKLPVAEYLGLLNTEKVAVTEWGLIASMLGILFLRTTKNSMQIKRSLMEMDAVPYHLLAYYSMIIAAALWLAVSSSTEVFLYFNF